MAGAVCFCHCRTHAAPREAFLEGSSRRHVDRPTQRRTVRGGTVMANDGHVALLKQDVGAWNAWRNKNSDIRPNLSGTDLSWAMLAAANLSEADLSEANLSWANLGGADLSGANLSGANLSWASLGVANLTGAKLDGADLQAAQLIRTDLSQADLTGCRIYGVSAWSLNLAGTKQHNLIV